MAQDNKSWRDSTRNGLAQTRSKAPRRLLSLCYGGCVWCVIKLLMLVSIIATSTWTRVHAAVEKIVGLWQRFTPTLTP